MLVFGGIGVNNFLPLRHMSFDTLARHYRWMELVLAGNKLQRCRTALLDRVNDAQNVLIVGEGNGRFLAECRQQLPAARITVVDASVRMLMVARAQLMRCGAGLERIEFVHADALAWKPEEQTFDLIVTHFFLDCFPGDQLGQIVAKLGAAAAPGAAWLLADFQMPDSGFRRRRAQIILALMYAFFRAVTRLPAHRLAPPDDYLKAHGFVLLERWTSEWGLLHTDLWRLVDYHSPPLASNTSARSKSCRVISPRIFHFGSSSKTTMSAVDSIRGDWSSRMVRLGKQVVAISSFWPTFFRNGDFGLFTREIARQGAVGRALAAARKNFILN